MAARCLDPSLIPPGALLTYYGDVASGAIRPDEMRIEALTFRAIVDPTGTVVKQSDAAAIGSGFHFVIRTICASILNPEFAGPAAGFVKFNLREVSRSFSIFMNPVSLSGAANNGSCPYHWDGAYITMPGSNLAADWSVDGALWTSLIGASKFAEIIVLGDYVACGPRSN